MNMNTHVYQCLWYVLFQNEMCVDKDRVRQESKIAKERITYRNTC